MASPRAMLTRVRRLERGLESPLLKRVGGKEGWAQFQAEVAIGIELGRYDRWDMPVVVSCLARWLR